MAKDSSAVRSERTEHSRVWLREQVTESAFYAWRRTIRERDGNGERDGASNSQPAFVPAVINGEAERHEVVVLKLRGDLELRLPHSIPAAR